MEDQQENQPASTCHHRQPSSSGVPLYLRRPQPPPPRCFDTDDTYQFQTLEKTPPRSEFQDIFDVDHFITSLRDEIRILKELPPRLKRRVELGRIHTMAPISWSDISYYQKYKARDNGVKEVGVKGSLKEAISQAILLGTAASPERKRIP
ncbi:hypothetical protein Vadar_027949 [Vaccinium darrowii]|uniref:Uncharacterized protein n=1 Tax=Vaccinium darrowii TaxID=229202 RepID=A0ACB7XDT9_9ERIC|nr:hypothetical protein Vadar_027949 [Vaccinium darrowii]